MGCHRRQEMHCYLDKCRRASSSNLWSHQQYQELSTIGNCARQHATKRRDSLSWRRDVGFCSRQAPGHRPSRPHSLHPIRTVLQSHLAKQLLHILSLPLQLHVQHRLVRTVYQRPVRDQDSVQRGGGAIGVTSWATWQEIVRPQSLEIA